MLFASMLVEINLGHKTIGNAAGTSDLRAVIRSMPLLVVGSKLICISPTPHASLTTQNKTFVRPLTIIGVYGSIMAISFKNSLE
jgi:hypothetical protein